MSLRRSVAVTLVLAAAIAAPAPAAPSARDSAPEPITVDAVRAVPRGGLSVDCNQLAPSELVTSVVGAHAEPTGRADLRAAAWSLPEAALFHDGGLTCNWAPADPERSWESPLSVSALPNAATFFEQNLPALTGDTFSPFTEFALFDGAAVHCGGNYEIVANGPDGFEYSTVPLYRCDWQVLADDVWVEIVLENLPASEVLVPRPSRPFESVAPVIEGSMSRLLVDTVVGTLLGSARTALEPAPEALPTCEQLAVAVPYEMTEYDWEHDTNVLVELDPGRRVVEDYIQSLFATSSFEEDWAPGWTPPTTALIGTYALEMWRVSFMRLGFRDCVVLHRDEGGPSYLLEELLVTRGLDWLVSSTQPTPPGERLDVAGLGVLYDYDCQVDPHCSYLLHSDEVLIGFGWGGSRDKIIEEARVALDLID